MAGRHAWAASAVAAEPGERLLEIGCGAGQATALVVARLGGHGSVLAIDRSQAAIARTQARNADALAECLLSTAEVALADLVLEPGSLDGAWALNVNVFWTADPAPELATLHRALRPGGRLLLLWDAGPTTSEKLAPVAGHLRAAGFREIAEHASPDGTLITARRPPTAHMTG